ncbi:MAG: hypothetical protein RIR00_558 [Pseudomonadota bacterium]|jgi:nitrite reductase (NADH) small subunit
MSEWKKVCLVEDIPLLGARVVKPATGPDIAVFRDAAGEVFAMHDQCPHKNGPLSQGIVAGKQVTCPLHSWKIGLADGLAQAPDVGHTPCVPVKVEDGQVFLHC